jgi:hypothetical protein
MDYMDMVRQMKMTPKTKITGHKRTLRPRKFNTAPIGDVIAALRSQRAGDKTFTYKGKTFRHIGPDSWAKL